MLRIPFPDLKPLLRLFTFRLPKPLGQLIPLLLVMFLIGLGLCGWITQRIIRTDRQEVYMYHNPIPVDSAVFARSAAVLGFPIVGGNRAAILSNGDAIFPAMLRDIEHAQKSIHMESFIFRSDKAGEPFVTALVEAARRGVQVRLLLDGLGSRLKKEDKKELEAAGVQVQVYRPLKTFRVYKLSQRTHRKILVIDGRIAYTGGLGIAKEWLGDARNKDEWRETQVRVEGPVVAEIQAVFSENWIYTTGEVLIGEACYPQLSPVGDVSAQAMRTANGDASSFAKMMYFVTFESARKKIYITNPYFIPDGQIRRSLMNAAKRGVDVEIILPGRNNDAQMVRAASCFHYGSLLKAGVKIYEYQPTMIHAKTVVIDGSFATVGSINFDLKSMKVNAENAVAFYSRSFGAQMEEVFKRDRERCKEIRYPDWKRRAPYRRLLEILAQIWEPYY